MKPASLSINKIKTDFLQSLLVVIELTVGNTQISNNSAQVLMRITTNHLGDGRQTRVHGTHVGGERHVLQRVYP